MSFNSDLADRIRTLLIQSGATEKKMFGGLGFLLNGNMCVGIWKDDLIARVGPDEYPAALKRKGAREFDITGRPMQGWVLVQGSALKSDSTLNEWIELALQFVLTLPAK